MKPNLELIKTIVVVVMENRSFDHLCGYLSLPPHNWSLDGLRSDPDWSAKVANVHLGKAYEPFPLTDPFALMVADPPHEWTDIGRQMGHPKDGVFPLDGFVTNYANAKGAPTERSELRDVMGYFGAKEVPVTHFFAENFAICDHWFSSLPAGTQANRLMGMAGYTKLAANKFPLPTHELVYDWLTERGIRWRVYHEGLPFFSMMLKYLPDIIGNRHFRPFAELWNDVQNEPPDEFPEVIFIEPSYTDAPHTGVTSDDHAPSAIKGGQQFLLEAYRGMSLNPEIWEGTAMIITYDEHGGFFDHVSPPTIQTLPPKDADYERGFVTLGIRVPGFVVSPFVKAKSVFDGVLDHVSVLKFIGERFGKDKRYSNLVDERPVRSVSEVFNLETARTQIPTIPPLIDYLNRIPPDAGYIPGTFPPSRLGEGFKRALDELRKNPATTEKFPGLAEAFPPEPPIRIP